MATRRTARGGADARRGRGPDTRPIASLTVSFGLVAIPVNLYSATVPAARISFNLLHAKDGSRLKEQYVCVKEGKVVTRDEIVKGYEFAKGRYVMFTAAQIKALEEAGSRSIEITDFVPLQSVDPIYSERTYYLAPGKGGAKPYTLFATALRDTERCAVGRWANHGREHIVMVRPLENGLAMHQLHFAAEVRSIRELGIEPTAVKDAELRLARQLIEQQASDSFNPAAYVDEVKQRIDAAIAKKVAGKEFTLAETPAPAPSNVIDLMAALRASVASGSRHTGSVGRAPARRAGKRPTSRRAARA